MNETLAKLKNYGCDIDGALVRTLGDCDFLLSCITATLEEPEFEKLGDALKKQDAVEAFEYAHALKGVAANVGLTPLYDRLVRIVEPLRLGKAQGLEIEYADLIKEKGKIEKLLIEAAG